MTTILLSILIALVAMAVMLQIVLFFRPARIDFAQALKSVEEAYQRVERSVREEIVTDRQEGTKDARESREELSKSLKAVGDSLNQQIATLTQSNDQKLDQIRVDSSGSAQQTREEVTSALKSFGESTATTLDALKKAVEEKLKAIQDDNTRQLEQMRATVDEKLQETLEKRLGDSFLLVSERLEQVHQGLGEMQQTTILGVVCKMVMRVSTLELFEARVRQMSSRRPPVSYSFAGYVSGYVNYGLLMGRTNASRAYAVSQRDGCRRVLQTSTSVGGSTGVCGPSTFWSFPIRW
jgi:DNA recombination protein RmuC